MNDMKSSIYSSVTDAVAAAKGAYSRYSKLTLNERQEILEGVKKALRPIATGSHDRFRNRHGKCL